MFNVADKDLPAEACRADGGSPSSIDNGNLALLGVKLPEENVCDRPHDQHPLRGTDKLSHRELNGVQVALAQKGLGLTCLLWLRCSAHRGFPRLECRDKFPGQVDRHPDHIESMRRDKRLVAGDILQVENGAILDPPAN